MQISNNTQNNFGKVFVASKAQEILGYALHKKSINGETAFIKDFRTALARCENSQYADLFVTNKKNVFIQDKVSGNIKNIDTFSTLLGNVSSALKHIIFVEENKFHF